MKGRKPKPVVLRALQGNVGKRRLPRTGSLFRQGIPEKPPDLDQDASEEWDRLTTFLKDILSPASRGMLLCACDAFSQFQAASRVLRTKGSTYRTTGPSGTLIRQRPEVRMRESARREYRQALAELGASPVSQHRVTHLPPPDRSGVAEFFEEPPPVKRNPRATASPGEESLPPRSAAEFFG